MSTLRNQFKATPTTNMKKVKEEEDSKIQTGTRRTDRIEIKDGLNKIRLFPKHTGEENFYHILAQHWLTISDDGGEDVRRTVLNAKIHAGWSNDPIDAYITYVKENLSSTDAEDAAKIKKLVDGYNGGLVMQTAWVAYAKKVQKDSANPIEMFEFKKTVRDGINDESIIEDEDESISTDPFTDPDDGKCLLLTYNSKAKKAADYYKVQISKTPTALSDEELEKFAKMTPLSQLPMFEYTEEMFELALQGIEHFDTEQEIDLFDTEGFQSIIEELRENFNQKTTTKKKPAATPSKPSKKIEEEVEEEEEIEEEVEETTDSEDQFSEMDRTELKKFIAKEKLGISVKTSMSDEDIREEIRAQYSEEEEEVEEEEEIEEEVEETPKKSTSKPATGTPAKKSLEDIKAELRAKSAKK